MTEHKIYTRIILNWDLEVLESDSFIYDGPMSLCWGGKSGGADSEAGGDAGRGEGRNGGGTGSSGESSGAGSERGVGNRTASRGGMAAENASGWGGSFGSVTGAGGPATDWGGAIEAALNDQAMSSFGAMGLAGAYAGAATGAGFGGYGGIVGATPDLSVWDTIKELYADVVTMPNKVMATPDDYSTIGLTGYRQMAAELANLDPARRAAAMTNLDRIGMDKPEAFRPDALAGSLPGIDVDAGLADLGLGPMDTMNNTFATDMHDKQFGQAVADLNAAARATSYESVVNAVYNSAVDSINGYSGMTADSMKDLAQISVPEVIGTVAKAFNPVTAVSALMDTIGYVSNDIHARDVLGSFTKSMGISRSLGAAVEVANMLAGGVPGLSTLSGVLGTGALAAGATAIGQIGRSLAPAELNSISNQLSSAGLSMSALDGNSSPTTTRSTTRESPSMSGMGRSGGGGNNGASPSVIPFKPPKSRAIIPFSSVTGSVMPTDDLKNKKEDPWYGYNQTG